MNLQPDKTEFLKLIQDNRGIILHICNAYCTNPSNREDLAQEIIYQLWKSGNSFNADHRFTTWMYRIALNVAISFYRKEKNRHVTVPLEKYTTETAQQADATAETEHNHQLLQQFINELKELDRALMIVYLEGKTYAEIADILGITETNVATKLNRIKNNLKEKIAPFISK